jgi:HEPN domain-containing protein
MPFHKTHDIVDLLTLVKKCGVDIPEEVRQAGILTEYAVDTRYPGLSEDVTEQEYLEAVELAEHVFRWAESLISRSHELEPRNAREE